ncbi:related to pisatin demethylase cytochrome P450 [Fusarium fujikuroi IMI 58289]|uniref:Related to pisatin demethylase cytochrome P450 n=1 Tax=Gibberella fujikuroi (strain CBS 195.34 / IMI 58289 / NRRL A-6831) TaxID=1279085 RepID=S0EHQ1_GIBF5|nr:related to pisatin demethylase cytochrome P450 [Fusarium fujikuroi IMI 58289]CCT74170.1 related to pisatin demethylase cytochrome P450 [Fusarium fujikuroi IMI 58289]SCO26450.1 related to pisatin demethylase cytochrome P450 [Fusarium fujikuroi]
MDHVMMVEPKSPEALVVSFTSGCLLHILFYRRGEWDTLALRILQAYATLPIIVIGLLRLAEFKGWQHGNNLSAASVLLLEGAHILGLITSILCYRIVFHPLNKFPGPLYARISNFYPTYLTTKNTHLYEEVEQLHHQYGDFVRLGPTQLSITHPKAIDAIYSAKSPCTKGPFYNILNPRISLHMIRDHKEHSARRKTWDRALSSKSLRDYEPRVTKYTTQLLDRLNEMQGTTINASDWLNFYSFDVMGDLAFGKSFNMLRDGVNHYFLSSLHGSMKMVGALAHISWVIPILKLIPAVNSEDRQFWAWISGQVEERSKMKPDNPDVFAWILEEYERNPKTHQAKLNVEAEAYLIAVAGSDTTAATLTGLLFELATNPSQIIKLREEIDQYFMDREHADHTSLSNLIHLNAVIDESLRLHPPVPSGLQRVTPPQGLMVGDTFIPGNTIVQVPMHTIQRDERNFARPSEFIPERWTTSPELTKDKTVYAPFSIGRYSCVGKQLGLMEVRYVIAHIIRAFDVRLGQGQTKEGFLKSKMDTFTLATPNLHLVFTPRPTT